MQKDVVREEHYTPGYSANASQFMAQRTPQSHAAFLLPYLRSGLRLLDCGCGPGTITLGLAVLVAPGEVVGIDQEASQLEQARQQAEQQGRTNIQFQEASLYELPFADNTFDVAFAHAVFEHLRQPVAALRELYRVLKPGGLIALRSPDWGGNLVVSQSEEIDDALTYYKRLQTENGGDVYVGRKFKALLRQSGFTSIEFSASYQCYKPLELIGEYLALRIENSREVDKAVEKGWATEAALRQMAEALRQWSQDEDGLFAQAWCEALASK